MQKSWIWWGISRRYKQIKRKTKTLALQLQRKYSNTGKIWTYMSTYMVSKKILNPLTNKGTSKLTNLHSFRVVTCECKINTKLVYLGMNSQIYYTFYLESLPWIQTWSENFDDLWEKTRLHTYMTIGTDKIFHDSCSEVTLYP